MRQAESQAVSTIKIKLASVEKREKEVRNERSERTKRTNERKKGREGGKHIYCDDALHVRTPA